MDIEVVVKGGTGQGKSSVARIIEEALTGLGARVSLVDDNGTGHPDDFPGVIEETANKRMESLVEGGLVVTVKTVLRSK